MSQLPPLEDIRVFVTAARLGGFSAAADQLDASAAYVSKRIGLLERALGVKLFLRSARSVQLTFEGRIALERSVQLLDVMDQMHVDLASEQQIPKGRLRIATSTGFGSHCVAPLISKLVLRYPDLAIDLELLDRPVDLISEGFDVEIRVGGDHPSHAIAMLLAKNHRILCASPDYIQQYGLPDSVDALSQHHCIGIRERDQSYGTWWLRGMKQSHSVNLSTSLMTNNGSVAKAWCLSGHGIMLRSIWNVRDELLSGRLVHVLPHYTQPADIYAIYTARLETSAKLRACVDYLKQDLPQFTQDK